MGKIKICIDSGHGFLTSGKRTPALQKNIEQFKKGEQIHEHEIATYICSKLAKKLIALGYDIFKSAWNDNNAKDDIDVGLTTRQRAIKNAKCDYSVSIHLNACGDGIKFNSGNGIEIFTHTDIKKSGDSVNMAKYILAELAKGTKQTNRGVKSMDLAMCNCTLTGTKAATLVEVAFMTNLNEVNTMITQEKFWDECAEEIANGLDKYIQSVTPVVKVSTVKKVATVIKNTVVKKTTKTGYVRILAETLNVRDRPSWDAEDVAGVVNKGEVFTVNKKITGGFYLLKSGLYVTSSEKFVEYFEK